LAGVVSRLTAFIDEKVETLRVFERLRLPLIGLIALLGLAAIASPRLMHGFDRAVERTMHHDIAWTGQHGRGEFHDLLRALIDHQSAPSAETKDTVLLRWDIFEARLTTWRSGRFGQFVAESPARSATIAAITSLLRETEPMLSGLDQPGRAAAIFQRIVSLDDQVVRIGGDAYNQHALDKIETNESLRLLQAIQFALIVALLGAGLMLVALMTLQNHTLRRSHRRQTAIAERNAFLASHDVLTELPNRKMFMEALEAACTKATDDRLVAVIAVDLDGFKPVNDVLGHHAGDLLLMKIARRLLDLAETSPGALAARFGGDEFLVMLQDVSAPEAAESFAERIREELREANLISGHRVAIDATIGVATSSGLGLPPEEILHRADIALNVGKASGKGAVRVFHPEMLAGAISRQELEMDLANASLEEEFEPYYQPVIDLATRRIVGVEALARWKHPQRGLVPPSDFIPLAESSGRIVEIGSIIMRKACADAAKWPLPITVAVNLSSVQLMRMDVPALAWQALAETGLPASRLKLEFTESVMIHDAKGTSRLMTELQDMNITVSLDDFGTGFSSLSYLRTFPFNELKIDRSFVADILRDTQAAAVVQTILALARNLDMSVVAEGIETEEHARLLTAMGCSKGQGWHFGKPMDASTLAAYLLRMQPAEELQERQAAA
jgi:diguanylate cyclase (GGDEF)-like protein